MSEKAPTERNTRQKDIIKQNVLTRKDHPTAEEVFEAVRILDSHISRGTVYRNLNRLADNGELYRVQVSDGSDRFDSTFEKHHHVLCRVCRRIFDVPIEYERQLDETAAALTGFTIEHHSTLFEGICSHCREKEVDTK